MPSPHGLRINEWTLRCHLTFGTLLDGDVRQGSSTGGLRISTTMEHTQMRRFWESIEGTPLPLGASWIESEQAFNFALHAEHAESVTLLFFSAADLVNPVATFRFRLPPQQIGTRLALPRARL